MGYKFEKLEVWQFALEYIELIYTIADKLPETEKFNLISQIRRAATSIALNIAEGSTSQSDGEQSRFLGYAVRSLIETVACQHLIQRHGYLESGILRDAYARSEILFAKLQAFRNSLKSGAIRESNAEYTVDDASPF